MTQETPPFAKMPGPSDSAPHSAPDAGAAPDAASGTEDAEETGGIGAPGRLIEDPSGMSAADRAGAAQAAAQSQHTPRDVGTSDAVWAPLSAPTFRMLWLIWMTANTCMWMNDVAAAWLMTSLTDSPVLVALVQSASTLPVFFLALPSGALADILDRRRYFIVTQFWVASVALLLCMAVLSGKMTPYLLLGLVFANGIGLAMRWPVFSALIPELVPKHHLPSAMALNGVAMNASRIIGPLVAGAIIASLGSAWVFVLNAALSVISGFVLLRWKRKQPENPLGRERLPSAMRVGLQFVKESPRLHAVLLRTVCYFLQATAVMALLPLTAKRLDAQSAAQADAGAGAGTYTLLLAAMGAGAILAAFLLPRVRQMLTSERTILLGVASQGGATLMVAFAPHLYVAVLGMMIGGVALLVTANTLGVAAQMALPNWVRARGMSIYLMSIMGSTAAGAALWGKVASITSVQISMAIAACSGLTAILLVQRLNPERQDEEDLSSSKAFSRPELDIPPEAGRVVVTIEYLIAPQDAEVFKLLMQESRRSRLRQGALSWHLLHSMSAPERFIEQIIDESWTEHLRRFERVTADDVALRDRKLALHQGKSAPKVQRYFSDTL